MKLKVVSKANKEKGKKKLPVHFTEGLRPDLIKRAVIAFQSQQRQPYGAKPGAGMRHSVRLSKKRRDYRSSYGYGISRVPRKILSARGAQFNWEGARAPNTKGGRRAHPPKASKKWAKKINKKERLKAIRCALSATLDKETVEERGHEVPDNYPFIVKQDLEKVEKTQDLKEALEKLDLEEELERTSEKKLRQGKGKRRGRKRQGKKGPLIVVSDKEANVVKAANNLPGVEAVAVEELNAELLAPGAKAGRLTLFTEKAIDKLEEEQLFEA